jgi:hypothetical protein
MTARQRLGFLGAASVAASLLMFAAAWLLTPAHTSTLFGIALEGAATAYGRVKGAEDLLAACALIYALWRREPTTLSACLLLGLVVPLGDGLALAGAGLTAAKHQAIHFVFVAIMLCSVALLRAQRKELTP